MATLKGYEKAGRAFRALGYLAVLAAFGIAAAVAIPAVNSGRVVGGTLAGVVLLLAVGSLAWFEIHVGRSIMQRRPWARTAGIVWGVLYLVSFPVGTLIGVYVLWFLTRGWDEPLGTVDRVSGFPGGI